jgi:hypothetical protein
LGCDQTFLNDPYHDAGLFVRRFKKVEAVQVKSFEWIVDDFRKQKHSSIGTPKQ